MVNEHNYPLRVLYRDATATGSAHSGFRLWSRHRSAEAAERSYRELCLDMPGTDIELVDVRTGERKRYGSAKWRRDRLWSEPFTLLQPPCSEVP